LGDWEMDDTDWIPLGCPSNCVASFGLPLNDRAAKGCLDCQGLVWKD
jgi:hypothetical protein